MMGLPEELAAQACAFPSDRDDPALMGKSVEERVVWALEQMRQHTRTEFCRKMTAWAYAKIGSQSSFAEHWEVVALAIHKSNCLWRLLYAGEELRTKPCPVHKGRWSGVAPDPGCGCWSYGNITGWLAEGPENPNAPMPPVFMVRADKP
jgi:hypothetical protein